MMSFRSVSACVLAILAAAAPSQGAAADEPAASKPPVQAIWKEQELSFSFQSFTTFYSCDSLEGKIKRILVAVGVNPELKLRTKGCFSTRDVARYPQVEITVVHAVEATPEALAERDKTRTKRELTARVRGETKQLLESEEQFAAEWRQVSLSRGRVYLDPGDCELIDQLKDKLFPELGVKVIAHDIRCRPNQIAMTQPKLVVEALFAMPKPDEAPANTDGQKPEQTPAQTPEQKQE